MRHKVAGRQLSRDTEHRLALRRNMAQSLFEHGKIRTTLPKALEVQPFVEKLITLARRNDLHARRQVIAHLNDRRLTDEDQEFILNEKGNERTVVQKLFDDIAPRFGDRKGGYTRIIKLPEFRIGDGGDLVLLQLLGDESEQGPSGSARKARGLRRKRNERRFQFSKKAVKGQAKTPVTAGGPEAPEEGGEAAAE
jgi:large subunit ribosomal protein L17